MKEIVKYHNDFNKLSLNSFSELQQNILFGVMFAIKDKKESIVLDYKQIREFTKNSNLTGQELWNEMLKLEKNLFKLDFTIIKPRENKTFERATYNLFKKFSIFYSTPSGEYEDPSSCLGLVEITINEEFAYLVDELTSNFTRFELAEFVALSGKYTKTLYRLLKQYRKTGYLKMEWDEFVRVMDIPQNYRQIDIDQWILKLAIKELTKPRNLFDKERIPFEKLTYTKLKGKGRGRGGNVIGIEFSFKPQQTEAIEQKDIYTEFAEKYKGKIFFFEKFGKFEFKGLGKNLEQERIFVFDNEEMARLSDKVSNYPTKKSLNELAKKIVN